MGRHFLQVIDRKRLKMIVSSKIIFEPRPYKKIFKLNITLCTQVWLQMDSGVLLLKMLGLTTIHILQISFS